MQFETTTNSPPTPIAIKHAFHDRTSPGAVIAGRLIEQTTAEPIVAQVLLMPSAGRVTLAEVRTDLQGFLMFNHLQPAAYRIVINQAGLGGELGRRMRVRTGQRVFVTIRPTQMFRVRM